VLYQSEQKCPVVILKTKKREAFARRNAASAEAMHRVLEKITRA
jgi:hypothetical protein